MLPPPSDKVVFGTNYLLKSPSSVMKMKAICSSKTLVSTYKSAQRYNPEDQHRHLHPHENLNSHVFPHRPPRNYQSRKMRLEEQFED
jgi:hypothetical protein